MLEVGSKIYAQFLGHHTVVEREITHETHDGFPSKLVIFRYEIAAHKRHLAGIQRLIIFREILLVLPVCVRNLRNRGHAEGINISPSARAVTLEIPLQFLSLLSDRELISGPRKMIHADIN